MPAALGDALRRLKAAAARIDARDGLPQLVKRRDIILTQASGLAEIAAGRRKAGIALLRKAAETERTMEVPFGPPLIEKPSFELLGDELAAIGRNAEAAEAYAALKLAPGRNLSLAGYELASKGQRSVSAAAAAAPHKH